VGTSCAIEGMYLSDGQDVLTADSAEAFADAIIRLHDDEGLWTTLSRNGLRNIEDYFSSSVAQRELIGLMNRAASH
jgi:O-antigen biosynthesis protein